MVEHKRADAHAVEPFRQLRSGNDVSEALITAARANQNRRAFIFLPRKKVGREFGAADLINPFVADVVFQLHPLRVRHLPFFPQRDELLRAGRQRQANQPRHGGD